MDKPARSGGMPVRLLLIVAAAALISSAAMAFRSRMYLPVQEGTGTDELATGKILVARRSLADPNFAQTVILLIQYEEKGTVGLIINRQTKLPLSRLSREMDGAKGHSEPLYVGGPVETSGVLALLRSGVKPEDAKHVSADIYVISNKTTLEKTIASASDPGKLRLYLGYAGWGPGQLEWEIEMDAWNVLPANAGIVFDPHPESLWSRLVEEEGLQRAGLQKNAPALRTLETIL